MSLCACVYSAQCEYDTYHLLAFYIYLSFHLSIHQFDVTAVHADFLSMAAPALVLVTRGLLYRSSMVRGVGDAKDQVCDLALFTFTSSSPFLLFLPLSFSTHFTEV